VRTQGRGREVDEFKLRPDRPDNHFLDCLTGACVAGSIQGVTLAENRPQKPKLTSNQRKSFAEAYAQKWGNAHA